MFFVVVCILTVSRASEWEGPTESEDQVPQHKLAELGRLLRFLNSDGNRSNGKAVKLLDLVSRGCGFKSQFGWQPSPPISWWCQSLVLRMRWNSKVSRCYRCAHIHWKNLCRKNAVSRLCRKSTYVGNLLKRIINKKIWNKVNCKHSRERKKKVTKG